MDIIAIVISFFSFIVSIYSLKIARSSFSINLREQWTEKVCQEFKACLPTNSINHKAGLRIARLADSMPFQLQKQRREIIEHGFHRAIPGLNFDSFWKHLCEIQNWPIK